MPISNDKVMERLARELGVLTMNNHILSMEVDALELQQQANAGQIDALTRRVLEQDETIRQLRTMVDARKTLRTDDHNGKDPN